MTSEKTATVHQLFPDPAKEAQDAMVRYQAGLADELDGKVRAIRAVMAYGTALLAGRSANDKRRSNIDFKQWVSDNKLDIGKPWNDRNERAKAMQIAELVVGNVPTTEFDACPNTRPTDIMKWYRDMHPETSEGRERKSTRTRTKGGKTRTTSSRMDRAPKPHYAEAEVIALADKGKSNSEISKALGIGQRQVRHLIAKEQTRRAAVSDVVKEWDVDPDSLAPSSKAKYEAAKRSMEKRLNAEHAERMRGVDEKVRLRVVAEGKVHVDNMKEMEAKAWEDQKHWTAMVNNHKPPLSVDEFNLLRKCLHQRGIAAKDQDFDKAFDLIQTKKTPLAGLK